MTVFGAFFSTGIPLPSVSAGCSTSWWRVHERPQDGRDLLPVFRTGADGNADRASPAKLIPKFASPGRRSDDVGPRVRNRMASSRSAGRKLNPVDSGAPMRRSRLNLNLATIIITRFPGPRYLRLIAADGQSFLRADEPSLFEPGRRLDSTIRQMGDSRKFPARAKIRGLEFLPPRGSRGSKWHE